MRKKEKRYKVLFSEMRTFCKIQMSFQYSRRQKRDVKQGTYWGSTSTSRHRTSLRPRSHVPVFDRTGEGTTWNFKTSPVLTGRSNDQERCDQAVVQARWSAMDRDSVIALFLSYRRRKRRRNGLHWVHPEIKKKGRIRCLLHTVWCTTRWCKQVFKLFSNVCFILRQDASPFEGKSSAS
jgi:hypothetical protein